MNWQDILLYIVIGLSGISFAKYLIYLITAPLYSFKQLKYLSASKGMTDKEIEKQIKVSVVIPAWNEEVGVLTSINSILANTYNNVEIIVVNDGSTDNTEAVVKDYLKNTFPTLNTTKAKPKYFNKANGGKGSALNYGIKKSTGDIVITMDADTSFKEDAIAVVARYFMDQSLDAAVGNVKVSNTKTLVGLVQQIEYTMGFYFKRTHSFFNSEYIIGGAFGVFRKELFDTYGYLDEKNKTEDIDYSTRLQFHGCKIAFIEDAIAYTEGASTIMGLFKQRLRWKKGRFDTFITYRSLFFSTEKEHRLFLTHFLLPLSLFYEVQLLLEPILTIFALGYMIHLGNYSSLFSWITLTTVILFIVYNFGSKLNNKKVIWIAPAYVFLYFIVTFAEIYAIFGSIKLFAKGQDVVWQNWNRLGVDNV